MDATTLGERELDVMPTLSQRGSGTVTHVKEALDARLAYTNVLTTLRNLEAKGFLRREEEGKAHRYFPRVARQAARRGALDRLIDKLFHGSPEQLLAHLVEARHVSPEELQRLTQQIKAKRGG